ncbi:hypothetical protein J3F83DRAFT_557150 [Trichoderma novae-zelandiae]
MHSASSLRGVGATSPMDRDGPSDAGDCPQHESDHDHDHDPARPQTAMERQGLQATAIRAWGMGRWIHDFSPGFCFFSESRRWILRTEYGIRLGQEPSAELSCAMPPPPQMCVQLGDSDCPWLCRMRFVHRSLSVYYPALTSAMRGRLVAVSVARRGGEGGVCAYQTRLVRRVSAGRDSVPPKGLGCRGVLTNRQPNTKPRALVESAAICHRWPGMDMESSNSERASSPVAVRGSARIAHSLVHGSVPRS